MGGRVTTGSDSGFIYQTYGFGYVNELEMLQEAGFHPLEVIQAATMNGALTLAEPRGQRPEFGIVRAGMLADMVIVDQNPLQNFKVLYGTGALKLNDRTGQPDQVGGVRYTIKDGIVYDAKQLLADVAAMVEKQKRERKATTSQER
jgi:imidazolonepropionase-like amidohydrolase